MRKNNSLRPVPPFFTYLQASVRKMVETTGSLIERIAKIHSRCDYARF